ncbi:MAG: hypothetical protein IPM97_12465 [Bdellovibrionaceae bacterium]|nr:hypothetical protein [Pseudobdellovibrionaceae bacterium]
MAKFCNETAWDILKYEKEFQRDHQLSADPTILKQQLTKTEFKDDYDEPWVMSRIPLLSAREHLFSISDESDNCGRYIACSISSLKTSLQTKNASLILNHVAKDMNSYPSRYMKTPDQFKAGTDLVSGLQKNLGAMAFCSSIGGLDVFGCVNSFKNIVDFAAPSSESLTPVPVFKEVFTNKKYIEGARIAALKILNRFQDSKVSTKANLHDDIYDSYIKTGMSPSEAEDASWNIIAILAAGGPNLGSRVKPIKAGDDFEILKVALSSISLAIPKLDFISTKAGHQYSMPGNISTTCDIGKPYHFLMTAFLARNEVKNGATPKAAAAAAYSTQKAYEMMTSQGGARDPNRVFTSDSFGSWNNMIRIDTGFSSTAAVYGANSAIGKNKDLNIDTGIRKIVSDGTMLPRMSVAVADGIWKNMPPIGYYRWQK